MNINNGNIRRRVEIAGYSLLLSVNNVVLIGFEQILFNSFMVEYKCDSMNHRFESKHEQVCLPCV